MEAAEVVGGEEIGLDLTGQNSVKIRRVEAMVASWN